MADKSERKRLRSGRWAAVFTATKMSSCNECGERIDPGDSYVVSRGRTGNGQIVKLLKCVASCEPLEEDWEPSTPEGNSLRITRYQKGYTRCGYCDKQRQSTKLRQRLDPKSLRIVHEMPLCDKCAEDSGYVLPQLGRNTNLIARPSGMPRL